MKRVLSLVLAVILAFGMATAAFAAAPKITDIDSGFAYYKALGSSSEHPSAIDMGEFAPTDEAIKLYLRGDSFIWDPVSYVTDNGGAAISSSQLSSGKITAKKKVTKGSNVLKDVTLERDGKQMYVKVKFVEEYVSTSEQDFDFIVYLAKNGSKQGETEIQIYGTVKNEEVLVDDGDEEVDLSDGQYAKAESYIKNIRVDTGEGLYNNAKMFDGKKYYAKSNQDVTASDDTVLNAYPEIVTVYYLNTINMSGSGNTVEFDIDEKYYVFNADGVYVGTTSDKLPFSSKYYLATARIDMSSDTEDPVEEPDPVPDIPTESNAGGSGTPNANDIPGTGVNGFVNVAVLLGVVALGAVAVTMKKK